MNDPLCQRLDDYLAHDLADEALARFTAHLPDCPECGRAVREHRRLAGLLSEATARLGPVPAELTERIGCQLRAARRRRFAAVLASLAAAAAVIWLLGRPAPPPAGPAPRRAVVKRPPPGPDAPATARVRVTFGPGLFAVPEKIDAPNVTFYWVYQDLRGPASAAGSPISSPERSH